MPMSLASMQLDQKKRQGRVPSSQHHDETIEESFKFNAMELEDEQGCRSLQGACSSGSTVPASTVHRDRRWEEILCHCRHRQQLDSSAKPKDAGRHGPKDLYL